MLSYNCKSPHLTQLCSLQQLHFLYQLNSISSACTNDIAFYLKKHCLIPSPDKRVFRLLLPKDDWLQTSIKVIACSEQSFQTQNTIWTLFLYFTVLYSNLLVYLNTLECRAGLHFTFIFFRKPWTRPFPPKQTTGVFFARQRNKVPVHRATAFLTQPLVCTGEIILTKELFGRCPGRRMASFYNVMFTLVDFVL